MKSRSGVEEEDEMLLVASFTFGSNYLEFDGAESDRDDPRFTPRFRPQNPKSFHPTFHQPPPAQWRQ